MATIEQRLADLENLVGIGSTRIDALFSETATLVPPGTIVAFAGVAAPTGWLLCDGSAVRTSTFEALAAVLGTRFGTAPEGFVMLPKLNGRVPVGAGRVSEGAEARETGATFGVESVALSAAHLPPHGHSLSPAVYEFKGSASGFLQNQNNAVVAAFPYVPGHGTDPDVIVREGRASLVTAVATGEGKPFEVSAPSLAVTYIIKH